MKKPVIISAITAVLLIAGAATNEDHSPQNISTSKAKTTTTNEATVDAQPAPKAKPICDGETINKDCVADGINYATYVYHPPVPEKAHNETTTTYEKKVTGYCTLCVDGTYSPSCATGRGACSYHGGVQEWNAPRYSSVATNSTKRVVDAEAQEAYYEKIPE